MGKDVHLEVLIDKIAWCDSSCNKVGRRKSAATRRILSCMDIDGGGGRMEQDVLGVMVSPYRRRRRHDDTGWIGSIA